MTDINDMVSANRVLLCLSQIKTIDHNLLDYFVRRLTPFLQGKQRRGCVSRDELLRELYGLKSRLPNCKDELEAVAAIFRDEDRLPTIFKKNEIM